MGLIYGYLLVVTSVLLHTQAHDRRYHGVAYHLRNVTFSGHFLHINGRLVCNEGFSMLDAAVVCRQMGNDSSHVNIMYNGTAKANTSLIGEGCRGSETRLQQCYFGIKSGCRRTIPVSIMCHKGEKQKTNITVLPSNSIRVYNGTTVTVTCLAKGRYMPSEYWYTWTLANTSNVVGSSPSISLRLDEAFRTKKNLTCSVAVRNQTQGNKSIDLQVLGDPPPLEATYDLHVGEILELDKDCNPRCNCSLRKVKGHRDQDSFDKIPCTMSITNKSQSGLYIIRRTNYLNVTIGEPRKGISAEVVEIQVSDKPTIECPEQQYVISSGSKRHQMCRFQSPWFIKNCTGDPQASCINCSIHTNEIHNRGNFTCEVGYSNKRLNDSNSTTFNIRLHILNANWTVLVMTGSNISLHSPNCSDTNSNNYTWQILSDDGKVSGDHSQLYNVTTSANYVGFSQKMANTLMKLEVLHEPEVTCDPMVSHPLGTRVSLKCSVNAVPGFSYITWTRHGEVIGNTTSDTWDLGDIGMVDKGSYICTAYNTMVDCYNETREGNGSCTITLDVYVEGDKRTVTVVASVLSLLLVCLMGVVGVLSGLLHVARREERRGNQPTKMLPLLTTPEPVKGVPPSDIYENA